MFTVIVVAPSIPISFNLEIVLLPAPPAPTTKILVLFCLNNFIKSLSISEEIFLGAYSSILSSDSLIASSINFTS